MEEEHTQVIQTIQNENKSKVIKLESQLEEMREKIQLGTSNSTALSELLADSEKKLTTIESDLKLTKKSNEDLQKEISTLTEGITFELNS
jgi:chromosome segregation ATPase